MKTLDLDQLSSITGGTAWAPIQYPDPFRGKQAGGGPTIYNPTIRDIITGNPRPTNPSFPGPRNPFEGIMNGR